MLSSRLKTGLFVVMVGVLGGTLAVCAEPAPVEPAPEGAEAAAVTTAPEDVEIIAARDRARLMHQVYEATLDVMHQRYFHEDRSMVPARAMEDIFKEMTRQTDMTARWISVNTEPMSVHHAPANDFEKLAAKAIAEGKPEFEQVEDGVYRRAGPIPLAAGCVGCHAGVFAAQSKAPKYAGLIIGIPMKEK